MARLPHALAVLAVAAAAVAAGCGDSEEPQGEKLPPSVSQALLQQLDSISDRVAANVAGACDDIYASESDGGNIEPIDAALDSIPSGVDPEIRSALDQSIQRLKQLVDEECAGIRSSEQEQQDTVTEETTPAETVTTETETTPAETTETTPTTPDTTPTTPTTPTNPPSGRGPSGNGPPGQDRGGAEAPGDGD